MSGLEKQKLRFTKDVSLTEFVNMKKEDIKEEENKPDISLLKQYMCHTCDNAYLTKRKLRDHNRYKHGELSSCNHCIKTFSSKKKLECHVQTVHDKVIRFKCSQCEKGFISSFALKRHNMTHVGTNETCQHCHVTFLSSRGLGKHISQSHKDKVFFCKDCNKVFKNRKAKTSHYKRVHCESVMCPECNKTFKLNHNFEIHKLICGNRKAPKPWIELTKIGKRKRMNKIIHVISGKATYARLNKKKITSLCCSLEAMSHNERRIFEKKMSENIHIIEEVTGKKLLTVEDIIHLFGEGLINVDVTSSEVECNYCGEEAQHETDLQKHKERLHPSQVIVVIKSENRHGA